MTDYEKAVHAAMVTIRESLDGATRLDKHGAMCIALAVSYTLAGYSPDQIRLLMQVSLGKFRELHETFKVAAAMVTSGERGSA